MTRPAYIEHVTLQTGHVRRSPRAEVADAILPRVSALLGQALAGGEPVIPGVAERCTLTAAAEGRCLIATVWAPPEGARRVPLATLGVALHSRCGARLWEMLHDHCLPSMPARTRRDTRPGVPWVAARLESGIVLLMPPAHWLGDLERCIAWAWIEERRREH